MELHPCSIKNCKTIWTKSLILHRLPHSEMKRAQWLSIIQKYLKNTRQSTNHIYLCSNHFLDTDFQTGASSRKLRQNALPYYNLCYPDEEPDPLEVTNSNKTKEKEPQSIEVNNSRRNQVSLLKNNLNKNRNAVAQSVVVIDDSSEDEEASSNKRLKTNHRQASIPPVSVQNNAPSKSTSVMSKTTITKVTEVVDLLEDDEEDDDFSIAKSPEIVTIDLTKGSDEYTYIRKPKVVVKQEKIESVSPSTAQTSTASASSLSATTKSKYFAFSKLNENRISYMTGLTQKGFDRLLRFCTICKLSLKKFDLQMSLQDQLLITLFKYRQNVDCVMITIMFNIDGKRRDQFIRDVVQHWTRAFYGAFSKLDFFKHGFTAPQRYRAIFHIEDFTVEEFTVSAPTPKDKPVVVKMKARRQVVVAVDETGAVLSVSAPYKNMSVREIFIASGVLDNIKPGENILTTQSLQTIESLAKAGKFIVNDVLVEEKDLSTKIKFLAVKTEIVKTCLRNVKKYKILAQNCEFYKLTDEIIYNCIVLKNFDNCIIDRVLRANSQWKN